MSEDEIVIACVKEGDTSFFLMQSRTEEEVAGWAAEFKQHNFFFLRLSTDVD